MQDIKVTFISYHFYSV